MDRTMGEGALAQVLGGTAAAGQKNVQPSRDEQLAQSPSSGFRCWGCRDCISASAVSFDRPVDTFPKR